MVYAEIQFALCPVQYIQPRLIVPVRICTFPAHEHPRREVLFHDNMLLGQAPPAVKEKREKESFRVLVGGLCLRGQPKPTSLRGPPEKSTPSRGKAVFGAENFIIKFPGATINISVTTALRVTFPFQYRRPCWARNSQSAVTVTVSFIIGTIILSYWAIFVLRHRETIFLFYWLQLNLEKPILSDKTFVFLNAS